MAKTEKEVLFKTIWGIAEDLRGAVNVFTFMSYVLGTLFYRYISENLNNYINRLQERAGVKDFDYSKMKDEFAKGAKEQIVHEKGFFILPSQLFCNVVKDKLGDENLNEIIRKIFTDIETSSKGTASEENMKGLFSDFEVDNNVLGSTVKERNEKLAKILKRVSMMDLGGDFKDNNTDVFGDAYEFLINMYSSASGKSGGEFFTPQEVSQLLAMITSYNNTVESVYDPACGSGSLLLRFKKTVDKGDASELKFYGQEINPTTYNLCRMNMFLHDVNYDNFNIKKADTLKSPQHLGMHFDAIVSNPPYSLTWDGPDNPLLIYDVRYAPAGVVAPRSAADLAFTMHMLYHLAETGTCAIVEFPGVLYRGGAEKKIREYLVKKENCVDAVIQLPQNLFFGVSISTCIIVLKKNKQDNQVLFVDASKLFHKERNKNRLGQENIDRIFETWRDRGNVPYLAKLVKYEDIEAKEFNLSVSSYVEQEDTREKIDIVRVNDRLSELDSKRSELLEEIDKIIEEMEGR